MAYRDDEIGQLRNKVNSFEKRLGEFETLYKKEGVKYRKSVIARFFKGLWKVISAPFIWLWKYPLTWPPFWIGLFIIGVVGGLFSFLKYDQSRRVADTVQAEQAAQRQDDEQCVSFCGTHGFHFYYGARRGNLCFCGTENSDAAAFIINVDTSENWTVSGDNAE